MNRGCQKEKKAVVAVRLHGKLGEIDPGRFIIMCLAVAQFPSVFSRMEFYRIGSNSCYKCSDWYTLFGKPNQQAVGVKGASGKLVTFDEY